MGVSTWDPVWAIREHQNQNHELVHIVDGRVILHLGNRTFPAVSGDVLLVPARHLHRDEFPLESHFEALLVHFAWPDLEDAFAGISNNDLVHLPLADKHAAREMALELYRTFRADPPLVRELTDAGLYRLLLFLLSSARRARSAGHGQPPALRGEEHRRRIIAEVKGYIRQNLNKPITLTDLAEHLKISSYHLSHVFSQESGFTLSSYVIRLRLEEAARLLAEPVTTVAEAAHASGFEDPNYFGKVFRRFYGQSPGSFHAACLKKRRR